MDSGSFLGSLSSVAQEAGCCILTIYHRADVAVTQKDDQSPLTEADTASHDYIVRALSGVIPGCPVISEESDPGQRAGVESLEKFWLVDPLDGTKEFIKKSGEFTVNIALIEGGRPVLGVVHCPVSGMTYSGEIGRGAWRQTMDGDAQAIQTRKTDVNALAVVASRDHAGPQVTKMLGRMPGAELASVGSSLKFCLVAEGKADVYLRDLPTMEWDTAAAQCVVEAAGGQVLTLDGRALSYQKPEMRNPAILTIGDPAFPWRRYIVD